MTMTRLYALMLGVFVIGLSIAKGVKSDSLPRENPFVLEFVALYCQPGDEFRAVMRVEPAQGTRQRMSRLYFGCKSLETLGTTTYYLALSAEQEKQLRSLGSAMLRTRSWAAPVRVAAGPVYETTDQCDRWWLWADDEGKRAPAMTRDVKLARVCG
jgi:hypothetical protein